VNFRYWIPLFTIFGMEFCCLAGILFAANQAVDNAVAVPLLMCLFVAAVIIAKALSRLRLHKTLLTAAFWIMWPIFVLLMIKFQLAPAAAINDTLWLESIAHAFTGIFNGFAPELLIIFSSTVLWAAGRRLAYCKPSFTLTLTEFQFGLIILIILFLVNYGIGLDQPTSLPIVMIFFTLGLTGISITHLQENRNSFDMLKQIHWPGMLAVSIIMVLGLGLLISIIINPDFINFILKVLQWAWSMIERLLYIIAGLFETGQSSAPAPEMPTMEPGETDTSITLSLPKWLRESASIGWGIIVIILVIVALWRVASQIAAWMRGRISGSRGEIENLRGEFWKDLICSLKYFLRKLNFFRFFKKSTAGDLTIHPNAAALRSLYKQLLQWGKANGMPRQKNQTPWEYMQMLKSGMGKSDLYLEEITGHYMQVRYGARIPSENILTTLEDKWHILKKKKFKKLKK
jgi:hypothetical protein